ncbi:MAG TPA: hypothetical protein DDY14_04145 [Chromatiaceae bacterium]|nr:hypothetical protein [Chromatiaceae bacterium]
MTSLSDIRATFLDYFAKNDHAVVDSAPLVPRNDPTLMFTNSGMVPFKNVFTGLEHRDYVRAATSQKCVRAGGKHNDLDNVGYTARHHTFFEMLGNFSFGDYFKERAIPLAWDLVTREYGLDPDRLLVTVYHTDDEAAAIWKKHAGLPDARIIRIATVDNFWSMGATGPCGPCTEIFYDHGPEIAGGPPGSPDEDGDRFVEIWNLVFMQYEQFGDGRRENLPRPSIDTGMGLERIGAVLQGVHDNYDTDLMRVAGLPTKIWNAKYQDLRRVDVGRWFSEDFFGERILTLEEALIAAGRRIDLNIELKFNGHDQQLAERVVDLVQQADFAERCIITSLSQQGLARVRELAPELRIGQIVSVAVGDTRKLDVDLLSMNLHQVTAKRVRANRRAGLQTHVWTVNDPADMARMLDYGVDNLITDEPAQLRAMITERAKLSDAELLLLSLGRALRD